MNARVKYLGLQLRNLGLFPTLRYKLSRIRPPIVDADGDYSLASRYSAHRLFCRPNTADLLVFNQIFVEREYDCLDAVDSAGLILDCGANVGYSSAYLLTAFPNATVIAVEPDEDNFRVLEKNLRPFGGRARCRLAAVWSKPTRMKLDEDTLAQGKEWGRTVSETDSIGSNTLPAVDIATLLEESGCDRISILKMDIEGAEKAVFAENFEAWIDRVDNIVIELHGPEAERIFWSAVPSERFDVSTSGELTVCLARRG